MMPKILVVDDDSFNINVLQSMIKDIGYESESALDGIEALSKIMERVSNFKENGGPPMYKIILLDYSMPEMDGPTTSREIYRLYADDKNIQMPYICCCTAYAEASFKTKAIESGMDYLLTKPVSAEELRQVCSIIELQP